MASQTKFPLSNFHTIIADPNFHLASILKTMLTAMGFVHVQIVRSSSEAYNCISLYKYDILLTELSFRDGSGLSLVERIRQTPECLNPTLPVIAISGRAELSDVTAARDAGINEFVVKPFTIKTIFNRLERVIEFPRNFLVSQNYIGPERRFRSADWSGTNRRVTNPVKHPMALATVRDWKDKRMPRMLVNDYVLKRKLGKSTALGDIITPEVLESAQNTVSKLVNSSLDWVSRSIETLQLTFSQLKDNPNDSELHRSLIQIAYELEGIAGTFSFHNAASIARLLRLFFQDNFRPELDLHWIVAEKHIDVLLVTFSQILKGSEVKGFEEILRELNYLTLRVS